MKGGKEKTPFDDFNTEELLRNLRLNLTKTKSLASAANNRSNDAAQDVRMIEKAVIRYFDRVNKVESELKAFYNLPWYKRLFYKGKENGN